MCVAVVGTLINNAAFSSRCRRVVYGTFGSVASSADKRGNVVVVVVFFLKKMLNFT